MCCDVVTRDQATQMLPHILQFTWIHAKLCRIVKDQVK